MDLMKEKHNVNKITTVEEIAPGVFHGRAFKYNNENKNYDCVGFVSVTHDELCRAYTCRYQGDSFVSEAGSSDAKGVTASEFKRLFNVKGQS